MIKKDSFNLKLELYIDDGFYFIECKELNVYGCNDSSFKKAFKELLEIINGLKYGYDKVENEQFLPKALRFKKKLTKLPNLK